MNTIEQARLFWQTEMNKRLSEGEDINDASVQIMVEWGEKVGAKWVSDEVIESKAIEMYDGTLFTDINGTVLKELAFVEGAKYVRSQIFPEQKSKEG